MSKLDSSVCMSLPSGIKVGADASYALSGKTGLASFSVGGAYTMGPLSASLSATSKSTASIGLLYQASPKLALASQTVHAADNLCTVTAIGGSYKVGDMLGGNAVLKAKMGGDGMISTCLVREVAPKVSLVASATMSSDLSSFKPGLAITM